MSSSSQTWTRADAIRDVLDASDGAYGIVDDGSGERCNWPSIPMSPLMVEFLARKDTVQAILAAREGRKQFLYCFGSGKAPKGKTRATGDTHRPNRLGICPECGREIALSNGGNIHKHRASGGYRERDLVDGQLPDVPCPSCGAEKGKGCVTTRAGVQWYNGRTNPAGRPTSIHRSRKELMGKQSRLRRKKHALKASSRKCGTCTACCTLMGVEEINKPVYTPCSQLGASKCGIYAQRPRSCAEFSCLWLAEKGEMLLDTERPDQVGVMFDVSRPDTELGLALLARETRKGAFEEPVAKAMLQRLAKKGLIVLEHSKKDALTYGCLGPEHLVKQVRSRVLK